jgi:hypothetical protein
MVFGCGSSSPDAPSDDVGSSTGGSGRETTTGAGTTTTPNPSGSGGGQAGHPGTGGTAGTGNVGGSGGAGGSTGTGGGMVRMDAGAGNDGAVVTLPPPAPCGKLAAVNVWETITPPGTTGNGVLTVVIDPRDHATVYTTLAKAGLYKSIDCGATWKKVNTGRNASVIDSGWQYVFVIDQVDGSVMYTSPLYGSDLRLFKSTNAGVDWDPIFAKGGNVEQAVDIFTEIFSIDTADHMHVVTNFHNNCKAPWSAMCLAETYDGGATWTIMNGPPSLGGWVEDAGPVVINGGIYLGVPFDGLFYSGDHGAHWDKLAPGGYFEIYHSTNDSYYMGAAQQTLQRSNDLKTWKALANTPTTVSNAVIGDGHRIFAAARAFEMYTASPESDGATFAKIAAPPGAGGAKMFAYDRINHLLYSANEKNGLFRMVTY